MAVADSACELQGGKAASKVSVDSFGEYRCFIFYRFCFLAGTTVHTRFAACG
jgi:hypothetical protein